MSILHVFSIFTPDQWAMIAAIVAGSPLAQYFVTEYNKYLADPDHKQLKDTLNWLLSFAFPAVGTIATFLVTNAQVSQAFPIFATLYTLGQGVYLSSVRFAKRARTYKQLYEAATVPEQL